LAEGLDHIRYFHRVEDEADVLYLSTANVLRLDATTEGVMARIGDPKRPTVAMVVRYGGDADVDSILDEFLAAISLTETPVPEGAPYEWDTGRWAFVVPRAEAPDTMIVGALDAPSAEEAQRLAEEALECVR